MGIALEKIHVFGSAFSIMYFNRSCLLIIFEATCIMYYLLTKWERTHGDMDILSNPTHARKTEVTS